MSSNLDQYCLFDATKQRHANAIMSFLFGKKKTPAQMLRQHQRTLNKAMRELDRERGKLEKQEQKLIADIKKSAKAGHMDATKIMAKDLVRTRRYVKKFYMMKTNLQGVALRIQTLRSNQAMAEAMKGCTKAMSKMNKQMNLPQIQKIMMEFEKESEIMDMKEEMISDTMDDVMGDEEDDEETDNIVNQVLDEIGIDLGQATPDAPVGGLGTATPAAAKAAPAAAAADGGGGLNDEDMDLQARLNNLRRE